MSHKKVIILAEDDLEDREIFQTALMDACPENKLELVENGVELMELLETISIPDIIVLDINMPKKSGIECLEEIRSDSKYDEVAIYMLSTSNSPVEVERCRLMGANEYFVKPYNLDQLIEIVEHICSVSPRQV